jgi:hypothetical protein
MAPAAGEYSRREKKHDELQNLATRLRITR